MEFVSLSAGNRALVVASAISLLSTTTYAADCPVSVGADAVATAPSTDLPAPSPEYALGSPRTVQVEDGNGGVNTLHYARVGSLAVFEGDIVLGDADRIESAAQSGPVRFQQQLLGADGLKPFGYMARSVLSGAEKWTNDLVPYTIDPGLPAGEVATVKQAMQAWSSVTPVRFTERTSANQTSFPNYVLFKVGSDPNACLSFGVGMMGGMQRVELVNGCGFGQIVHEIGHVLGLDHEQNRSDRDEYVRIDNNNIMQSYTSAFQQRPSVYKDIGEYDYDSIMHYEPTAFSCNGKPTIEPTSALPSGVKFGQRDHVSKGDIAAIKSVYK